MLQRTKTVPVTHRAPKSGLLNPPQTTTKVPLRTPPKAMRTVFFNEIKA
ncbi:MAG: hypothetical protein U1E02_31200 [Hydrogenophaga sp.]|nr:hypothetical protein [Hydrogenophaga sp.]